ncbi:MAG: tetratricopeptide repeat protein [Bacteroidota bacterium]
MRKLILTIGLLIPVVLLGQPNSTIQAFRAEKVFLQGKKLYGAGQYQQALSLFNQVIELNPTHPMVYELRGESFYMLNDYSRALDDYTRAVDYNPNDAELRNSQGVAAAKLDLYDAAATYFYQALQIDPNHEGARKNLDIANRKRKEIDPFAVAIDANNPPSTTDPRRPEDVFQNDPLFDNNPYTDNFDDPRKPDDFTDPSYGDPIILDNEPVNLEPLNPRETQEVVTYASSDIKIGSQSDALIAIRQVKITQSSTFVTFRIRGAGGEEAFPIKLDKRGGPNAWYITDRSLKRNYRLKNIKALTGWPSRVYNLRPNEEKIFVVEFERIDNDVRYFHILEGRTARETSWDFYDIELIDQTSP